MDEHGAGEPPLLFVHGWTCDRSYFEPQVQHFSRSHRCVTFDHRGHGASGKPGIADYSIATLASDAAAVATALGVDRPVVVGHSMGAVTAFELAAGAPETVRGVVLVDPAPLRHSPFSEQYLREFLDQLDGEAGDVHVRRRFIDSVMFVPDSDPDLRARIITQMTGTDTEVARECWAALVEYEPPGSLPAGLPVLHIAAATPVNSDDQLRELAPGVELAATPEVGHFNQLEAPDRVNDLIERFVKRVGNT